MRLVACGATLLRSDGRNPMKDNKDKFWEIVETEWKDVVAFKAVAIIPLEVVRNVRLDGLALE